MVLAWDSHAVGSVLTLLLVSPTIRCCVFPLCWLRPHCTELRHSGTLFGTARIVGTARHRGGTTVAHHCGTTAPLDTTTTPPLHGTMALLREAANATDRTRPTAPLENTKYLFSAICGLSETGRGRNKRSGTLMSHITVNHELWGAFLSNLIKWRQNLDHLDHSGFSFLVLAALVVMHLGLQCGITQIKVNKKI